MIKADIALYVAAECRSFFAEYYLEARKTSVGDLYRRVPVMPVPFSVLMDSFLLCLIAL